MSLWIIEPRDPLVVRDGRPNHGRSESATLPFPYPSTIAGLVRTRLGSDADGVFDPEQDLESLRRASIRGPLLARPADGALFVPAPRDAIVRGRRLLRLAPLGRPEGAIFDEELAGEPVGLRGEAARTVEKAKEPVRWWPWKALSRWLGEPEALEGQEANKVLAGGLPGLPVEGRVHVKLGESWTAEDGMLFEARGLRFTTEAREALALAIDVDASAAGGRALREGVGPGGGERRLVRWEQASRLAWPAMPEGVREALAHARRVRVVLLTPAIFAAGHRPGDGPGALLAPRAGVTPKLVATCVPRPETISGWDFERGAPKATRRVASAGSVYWLDLEGPPEARVRWAEEVMMTSVSDAEQDRRDGFGLAAVGVGS